MIGCAFTLAYEVCAAGLSGVQQYGAKVHYKDIVVGEYSVDLPVDDVLLVELETANALDHPYMPRGPDAMHQLSQDDGLQLRLLPSFSEPHRRPPNRHGRACPGHQS
jgi:hypothetical protein